MPGSKYDHAISGGIFILTYNSFAKELYDYSASIKYTYTPPPRHTHTSFTHVMKNKNVIRLYFFIQSWNWFYQIGRKIRNTVLHCCDTLGISTLFLLWLNWTRWRKLSTHLKLTLPSPAHTYTGHCPFLCLLRGSWFYFKCNNNLPITLSAGWFSWVF